MRNRDQLRDKWLVAIVGVVLAISALMVFATGSFWIFGQGDASWLLVSALICGGLVADLRVNTAEAVGWFVAALVCAAIFSLIDKQTIIHLRDAALPHLVDGLVLLICAGGLLWVFSQHHRLPFGHRLRGK